MPELFEQPLKLVPNRFFRSFPGGREIDRFRGIEPSIDDENSEAWVGSTTWNRMDPNHRINRDIPPDMKYGIAQVELGEGVFVYMDDLVAENPAAFLGDKHAGAFGANTGILVKLLDAREQLILGAHPSREVARTHFQSEFGKAESWYILGTRADSTEKPYILIGFKEGVTKDLFEELYEKQDIQAMDECCHKIEVAAGEMYFIDAGLPHAVGPGCFLLEVQEPTDLSVSIHKWVKQEDPRYESMKQRVMHCIDFTGRSKEETLRQFCIKPDIIHQTSEGTETLLLGKRQTAYFGITKLHVNGEYRELKRESFSIAIITEGEGELITSAGVMKLKKSDELFLPSGIRDARWKAGKNGLTIVKAFPEGVL